MTTNNNTANQQNDDATIELEQQRARNSELETKLRNLGGKLTDIEKRFNGIDPEEYKALKEEISILKKQKGTSGDSSNFDEEWTKREKELTSNFSKKYDTDIGNLKAEVDKHKAELYDLKVTKEVFNKISGKFVSGCADILEGFIKQSIKLADDGSFYVVDKKGEKVYKDGKELLTVDDWADQLAKDRPYIAKDQSVSGTKGTGQDYNTGLKSRPSLDAPQSVWQQYFRENKKALPLGVQPSTKN